MQLIFINLYLHTIMYIENIHVLNLLTKEYLLFYILAFVTLGVISVIIYNYHRYRRNIKLLNKERLILKNEISKINTSSDEQQQIIKRMERNTKLATATYEEKIFHFQSIVSGMHFYIAAIYNKNLSQLDSHDLHCFIECYKEIDKAFSGWIEKKKSLLTNRETAICILIHMQKEKQDIINLLHCSDGSYRTIKNRIKGKLHMETSEYEFEEYIRELH